MCNVIGSLIYLLEVSRMKSILLAALLSFFVFPALALAQGSGSERHQDIPQHQEIDSRSQPNSTDFEVLNSFAGEISEIGLDSHLLVVEDKDGKSVRFKVDDQTKFKADKKTELEGRKNLKLDDFEKGQTVKVVFVPSDNRAVEVRLRHVKS